MIRRALATALLLAVSGVAPALAQTGADWLTYGFDTQRSSYNSLEKRLGPSTVSGLVASWTFDAGAFDASVNPQYSSVTARIGGQSLVVTGVNIGGVPKDLVLFGDNNGMVYALDANPPTSAGSVVWYQPLGNFTFTTNGKQAIVGIRAALAVDRAANGGTGAVYVPLLGSVHALDLTTGAELAGWPVSVIGAAQPGTDGAMRGGPNLYKGQLYVGTSSNDNDMPPYFGHIVSIDTATATVSANWFALSGNGTEPTISGGGIWGWGGVAIDPLAEHGGVYVATGNAKSGNGQVAYAENIVNLTPTLSQVGAATPAFGKSPNIYDNDYGSTPVLFRPHGCANEMLAALNKTGQLAVDGVSAKGTMSVLQSLQVASGEDGVFRGTAAWDPVDQLLLVTSQVAGPAPFMAGLLAFKAGPSCSLPLSLAWQTSVLANGSPLVPVGAAISSPTAANGVAYFAVGGATSNLFAVATSSGGTHTAGEILWESDTIRPCTAGLTPTVVDGRVILGCEGMGGSVNVFQLPAK